MNTTINCTAIREKPRQIVSERKKYSADTTEDKLVKERIRKDSLKKIAKNMSMLAQFVES